ncbi:MAG TPA: transcription-repair coupling factor [Candidatus Gracilibacteria bacterium]
MPKVSDLPFRLEIDEPLQYLQAHKRLTFVNVGNAAAKAYLMSQLFAQSDYQNIFWASGDEQSDNTQINANSFFDGQVVAFGAEVSLREYYHLRQFLAQKTKEKYLFLFEQVEATLAQKFPTDEQIDTECLTLKVGEKIRIFEVFEKFGRMGYDVCNDPHLGPGEFVRRGEHLFVYPINAFTCYRINLFGDDVETIEAYHQPTDGEHVSVFPNGKVESHPKSLDIYPATFDKALGTDFSHIIEKTPKGLFIADDLDKDLHPEGDFPYIVFTTFPDNEEKFYHLNFFSVLPFYTVPDFITEVKERFRREFTVVVATKKIEELKSLFREYEIMWTDDPQKAIDYPSTLLLEEKKDGQFLPHSFQNNDQKILYLTDREIFYFRRSHRQQKSISAVSLDLINSLKAGDYVIHNDHGLALFDGIVRRKVSEEGGEREYLKLCYALNDKLFVPVESAEKVTKFIGDDNPKLSRLGSADWQKTQKKLKKETERIAKELLKLYASRELAKAESFAADDEMMKEFCDSFPYELTPGQAQVWEDVRIDMERPRPMDRLVCGDVGFGKTEIAMRAAFKCFRSGRQCALLSPITILAEQHYESFMNRIAGKNYGLRVELLSRFQTKAEQSKILKDLEHGLVDIVVGTHRLLSEDIKFKKLGVLIIDEEQRFGVKQKEKLKTLKSGVDLLTLTATPIPRTLHMGLNKLKDISTITTPPPGRLPVVTEVRKYNLNLIREQILKEIERGGQVYFLHNQVRTIEGQTAQLKSLIPEATFIVAHGQLSPHDLEDRIKRFKNGEANVLVASTIIENGIDLANANTLFVNHADKFGLSQLYQLRGRVGRSRTQAYAFFLYHGQKLALDSKKRLRAIVEASELGAGFQIAMKDLEIRGAGEILGASQSGAIKDTGVSHFMRLLHKTIEEMKSGELSSQVQEEENISVEIPLSAYIPPSFIPNADEKIQVYQELASCKNPSQLEDLRAGLAADYGVLPAEVENLCKVIRLKMELRKVNIVALRVHKASHKSYEIILRMGANFEASQVFGLLKVSKFEWIIGENALKLQLEHLPITWYQDLLKEIACLAPLTKEMLKKG